MIRDTLKSEEYFIKRYEKDIQHLKNAIIECNDILSRQGEDAPGKIMCYYDIYVTALETFYSGYSLGISLNELRNNIDLILENIYLTWDGTVYDDIRKAFELAIIFDIRSEKIVRLMDLMIEYRYEDKYLYMLAKYLNPHWQKDTDEFKFKKATIPLVEVIELASNSKKEAAERLKTYLNKQWFNMQKEGLITNKDHLKENKYRGYWCIEASGLVKMLNLDDEILKESNYYPYDLAHYKE